MLAPSRNDRVINRTEILTVSIRTRKGFNQSGAPDGRKWAINSLVFQVAPLIIIPNHNGRPKAKVKSKCPVDLKTYGNNPIMLRKMINMNNAASKCLAPFMNNIKDR